MSFCKYLPKVDRNEDLEKSSPSPSLSSVSFLSNPSPCNVKKTLNKRKKDTKKSKKTKIDVRQHNIFHIDSKIREKLGASISSVEELYSDLDIVINVLSSKGRDPMQKFSAKQQAAMLRKRIQDLESTMELSLYTFRTAELLEKYREMNRSTQTRSFVNRVTDENSTKKNTIVNRFLSIAQEYIDLEHIPFKAEKMRCGACASEKLELSNEDDSIYICTICGSQIEILDDTPCFKDTDRVNLSSKYRYTTKGHFIGAFKRYQGNQNTDPVKIEAAVDIIEKEMHQHNLVAEQGKPNSICKDHVYMFLSEQNLSSHYDDINLLWHLVTGEPCPDHSSISNAIIDDFDQLERVLEKIIEQDDRTNTLTVNYKLYKILQHRGVSCKKDDFYILRTDAKKDEHDEKMKQAFKKLGWEWIPTF